jgi:hypothetical protein
MQIATLSEFLAGFPEIFAYEALGMACGGGELCKK